MFAEQEHSPHQYGDTKKHLDSVYGWSAKTLIGAYLKEEGLKSVDKFEENFGKNCEWIKKCEIC